MNSLKAVNILVATLMLALAGVASAEDQPIDVINGAIDNIAVGLAANRTLYEDDKSELYAFVDELLDPRFDRNYAGRLVLAKHWRTASTEQKRRFIDGFYSAMLSRYAEGILEFREDIVKVLPPRGEPKKNRAQVKTLVTIDSGEEVPVNYGLVKRGDAGWKVYDVTIEGISYITNFRAEIDSEIKKTSLDAVIARLEKEAGTE
ncbi:MAG: ABC transporter substrate-binding protein [Pseudomonadota bacterium]